MYQSKHGLQALSEEMLLDSVDALPPLAKEAAAFCRYQKMALQMVGADGIVDEREVETFSLFEKLLR